MSSFTRILRKNAGDKRRRTARHYFDRETGALNTKRHETIAIVDAEPKEGEKPRKIRVLTRQPSPTLRTGGDKWRDLAADAIDRRARGGDPAPKKPAKFRRSLPDDPRGLNHKAARLLRKLTAARARYHLLKDPKGFDPRAYAVLARMERLRFVDSSHRDRGALRDRWGLELAKIRGVIAELEVAP